MITGSIGVVFVWLNTLMLVANATVTTINSIAIMREMRNHGKKNDD